MAEWVPQCGACGTKLSAKRMRHRRPRCAKCRQPYDELADCERHLRLLQASVKRSDERREARLLKAAREELSRRLIEKHEREFFEQAKQPSAFGPSLMIFDKCTRTWQLRRW